MTLQPKLKILAPIFLLITFFSGTTELLSQTNSSLSKSQSEVISLLQQTAGLIQNGKFTEAETLIRRAVTIAPSNADAHNLLGVVLDRLGKMPEAEKAYRTAIRLNPKAVSPLANLGVLLAKTNRQEAVRILESVLRLDSNHPQTIINLGFLYVATQNFQKAVPFLKRAADIQPDSADIKLNLGIALFQTNNP